MANPTIVFTLMITRYNLLCYFAKVVGGHYFIRHFAKFSILSNHAMKQVVIFGSLPSGFGGMESVFIEFGNFFNREKEYSVNFYMYELNNNNDYNWLSTLNYQVDKTETYFRFIQKLEIKKNFMHYMQQNRAAALIIAFDPLSVFLAKKTLAKLKLAIPVLSWLHFPFLTFKPKYQHYVMQADYHLSICDSIKKQMLEKDVPDEKVFTIYNPVSRKNYVIPRPQEGMLKFLYVGRIQYAGQKNLSELFYAIADLNKPYVLDIVGNGAEEELIKLKSLAVELGIDSKISWHGWQQHPWEYVKNNIKTISALILTSTFEGFPMTLCEAMSLGIWCISSDCNTGPRDIINEKNGLLYQSGRVGELTACLNKVCVAHSLPNHCTIQASINHLYDRQYVGRLKNIFSSILAKQS